MIKKCALTVLISLSVALVISAATPRSKTRKNPIPIPVNVAEKVDSALVLVDAYADAFIDKPEFSTTRLNIVKAFYNRQPSGVQDFIRNQLFSFFVNYIENEKDERATAFKECYEALAPDTCPNLGPLYAMELAIGKSKIDTLAVQRAIDKLEAYSLSMNVDYDEELSASKKWLARIRNRKPITEAICGVWVSEDICGFQDDNMFSYNSKHSGDIKSGKPIICTTPVLALWPEMTANGPGKIRCLKSSTAINKLTSQLTCRDIFERTQAILGGNSIASLIASTSKVADALSMGSNEKITFYVDTYSAYVYFGHEKLSRPNAEIAAISRQTIQQMQSMVHGELSRSKYSTGDRIAGGLAAGVIAGISNGIIDGLMVSKDKIWGLEISLQLESEFCMVAMMNAIVVETRSDSNEPKVNNYQHVTRYYKWTPEDDVYFVGIPESNSKHKYSGVISHIGPEELLKQREGAVKEALKLYKEYEKEYRNNVKESINKLPKTDKNAIALEKSDLKKWEERHTPFFYEWNRAALEKLKAKAEKNHEN